MLELGQIESFFPERLRHFKRNLLREYLQYKILDVIFRGPFGQKLAFMGGTAIHIVYGLPRFSEDLDFDNRGLRQADFSALVEEVARRLFLEGHAVETDTSFKGAYSARVKFPELLYKLGLSGHQEEKFLIKLDAEPQLFTYKPDRVIINKFAVLTGIALVPATILLAQKYFAILARKRAMGRDFFDAMFLAGKVDPDYSYLQARAGIGYEEGLKSALLERCAKLDFALLARDVEQFLFSAADAERVMLFPEFVGGWGKNRL